MSEAGLYRGLDRAWRLLLFRLIIAALDLDPASATAAAMSPHDPSGVPSNDFCTAKGQGRILRADPTNYQKLLPALQAGDTLLLTSGRYPRLTIANLNGEPGRCITITGPA